jgi:phage shock protein E
VSLRWEVIPRSTWSTGAIRYTLGGMRRLLALIAALLGVTALLAGCSSDSGAVSTVDPAEFVTAMAEPGPVIVDVRTPEEFAAGHVDGAVNIDVESGSFGTEIAALPKDTTYAVYCRSGRRSAVAADQMSGAGFTSIVNLDGGVADLQSAGAPIVAG